MITEARACPSCHRRLFPTRDGHWPHHMRTAHGGGWCKKSGDPIEVTKRA